MEDGTPTLIKKDDTNDSTYFKNNYVIVHSDKDLELIKKAKQTGGKLETQLWRALHCKDRKEIISKRNQNSDKKDDHTPLPKQYGLNNVRIFTGDDGSFYATEDDMSIIRGGASTSPSVAQPIPSVVDNNNNQDGSSQSAAQ